MKKNLFYFLFSIIFYISIFKIKAQESTKSDSISKENDKSVSLEDVVVLGSRALPRVNTQSPVPVDVIDMKKMSGDAPQVNLTSILNYTAPSFTSTTQTVADGSDHIDPATLRGLGPDQTLILLNGKRRHNTSLVNINGTVGRGSVGTDLNAIPSMALEKLEVLRDGAAAQYGSDAIAGVINLGLRRNNKGTQVRVTYGTNISTYKAYTEAGKGDFSKDINPTYNNISVVDGGTIQVGINHGMKLGEKGFLNITGNFDQRNSTNRAGEGTGPITASGAVSSPTSLAADDAFLKANNLTRMDIRNRVGQSTLLGGGVFLNGAYTLNESNKQEIYFFGGYSYRNGESGANYRKPGNSANATTIYPIGFLPIINSAIQDLSFAFGLKGKKGNWNYDISNTIGTNIFGFTTKNTLNRSAVSSTNVLAGKNAGITIDSNQKSFDAGTLAFLQNTTNIDLSRNFDVLKGLNLAFGGEFRIENYSQTAGETGSWANYNKRNKSDLTKLALYGDTSVGSFAAGAQGFGGLTSEDALSKSRNSMALYLDVEQNFTKKWLVNAAVRFENYSDFGSNLSWKAASRYLITNWLTVRGSVSTGFRAPSLHQRYLQKVSTITAGGVVTQQGNFANDSKIAGLLGIPALKPELSLNSSIGFTMSFTKFKFTVDAYNIDITDRIIMTGAFVSTPLIAADLANANAGSPVFFANALNTNTKGIDVVLSHSTKINSHQSLRIDLSGNYTKTTQVGNTNIPSKLGNQSYLFFKPDVAALLFNAVPLYKSNLIVNYTYDKFSLFIRENLMGEATHVDATAYANAANTADKKAYFFKQDISSVFVTDISVSYEFTKNLKFTIGSNNIFDVYTDLLSLSKGKFYAIETDATKANYNVISTTGVSAKDLGITNLDALTGGSALGNQFNNSRRVSMIGLNGRFVFVRLEINL